jgi:hypothetical protein
VAVIVYEVEERTPFGVPLITQLTGSIESPTERRGEVVQFVIGAPRLFRIVGITVIRLPTDPLVPFEPVKLITGRAALTVSETAAEDDPTEFVAVMV